MAENSEGSNSKKAFFVFLSITVLYAFIIFWLSSSSQPPGTGEGTPTIPHLDYIAHLVLYGGFTFFVFGTLVNSIDSSKTHPYTLSLSLVTLYGLTDEVHQYFVPGRTFSLFDLFFDFLGALLMLLLIYILDLKFLRTGQR